MQKILFFSIFFVLTLLSPSFSYCEETGLYHEKELLDAISAQTANPNNDDIALIKRLLKAYQASASDQEKRGNSMWQLFFNQRHLPIHQIFKNGSFEAAAAILRDPSSSDLFYGFDSLASSIQPFFANPVNANYHALTCLDCLARFAEISGAIGCYRYDAPLDANTIIEKIEKSLGITLVFPNPYPYEYGLWTSRGIVSYRPTQALYQAWRIKQLLKGKKNPKVLEIGAGLGRTAHLARLLGIEDYTIVDLPFTAISAGYFLGVSLGDNNVELYGEKFPDSKQRVKFLTQDQFLTSSETYDLIINVDSLTEMDPVIATAYWNKIEKSTGLFLSINHDLNLFTVQQFIAKSARVARVDRFPYWMRSGYAEELVRFKPN